MTLLVVKPQNVSTGPPVAGYIGWWDASDTSSITQTSGNVSQWNDKSTNANHLVQSNASKKPTYTTTLNGLNVVSFNGTSQGMATSGNVTMGLFTIFTAGKPALVQLSVAPMWYEQNNPYSSDGSYTAVDFRSFIHRPGGPESGYTLTGTQSGNAVQLTHTHNGTHATHDTRLNGSSIKGTDLATNDPGSTAVTKVLNVGARGDATSLFFTGDIGELVFYDSYLSTTDRNAVEAYLKSKWATP